MAAKMPVGGPPDEVLRAYAGHRLRELRASLDDESYERLGKRVGISKPTAHALANDSGLKWGDKTKKAIAIYFFKGSTDDFERAAWEWSLTQPAQPAPVGVRELMLEERYHAMPEVRKRALKAGFDPQFVERFQVELDADDQPSADQLFMLMSAAYSVRSTKSREGGDPLAGLDEPRQTTRKKRQ